MPLPILHRLLGALTLVAALPLLLAGCLFTEEPILDETNSTAGAESAELQQFLDVSRNLIAADEGPDDEDPVPFFSQGQAGADLSIIRVATLPDGMLLIQEHLSECPGVYCYVYYGVRVRGDGLPEICLVDTEATEALLADAPEHGVTLVVMENDDKMHLPPDVGMNGAREKVLSFVVAQFEQRRLECDALDHDASD